MVYLRSDSQFLTYVNNHVVTNQQLFVGDVIFINGLKLIWMRQFIQINNPNQQVTVAGL